MTHPYVLRFRRQIAETVFAVVHDGATLESRLASWRAHFSESEFEAFEAMVREKLRSLRPGTGVLYWFMDADTVQCWIDRGRPV